MQNRKYKFLLYFISFVVLVTFGIQFYWNYRNYQNGKQQLLNEIQTSLDQAIDSYYIDLAEENSLIITQKEEGNILENPEVNEVLEKINFYGKGTKGLDSIDPKEISSIEIINRKDFKKDNGFIAFKKNGTDKTGAPVKKKQSDSLQNIAEMASRIIVSITTDTLNLKKLTPYIDEQLSAKNIEVNYGYVFQNKSGNKQGYNTKILQEKTLSVEAKSGYLPDNSRFSLYFTDATYTILKRNIFGLALSAILMIAVVGCLFFLLRVINRQKQLSELKNDLINNITHEFKTPISTIGAALEGIEHFNEESDPKKTKNYLAVSNNQLGKLNLMVEKLLETATLDGKDLQLNKENFRLDELLQNLVEKHKSLNPDKHIELKREKNPSWMHGDIFHLENAFNNILDNSVKYGGQNIRVSTKTTRNRITLDFFDDGKALTSEQSKQVFDKFYRVPKGNTHDVKGFGIGLFYTKNIIEQHGGNISVSLKNGTHFLIDLPYE